MSRVVRGEPPYLQVFRSIRQQIVSGHLVDGDPVPSIRQLAEEWGISRATATRSVSALQSEGLIETRPGAGSVVSSRHLIQSGRDRLVSSKRGKIYPPGQYARIVSALPVDPPADVRSALRLPAGSSAIERVRVVYERTPAGDQPVSYSRSWVAARYAEQVPELLRTDRIPAGTIGRIAQVSGVDVPEVRQSFAATEARPEHAAALRIAEGTPVQAKRTWYLTAAGEVIEYGVSWSPRDRWTTVEYRVEPAADGEASTSSSSQP